GGDDAAEDLERRLQRDVGDGHPGEDRGYGERTVGDDVEGRQHRGALLGRGLRDERAEGAEGGGAGADIGGDRAREVGGGGAGRRGGDDDEDARGERDRADAGREPGSAPSGQELRGDGGGGERDDAEAGEDHVAGVEELPTEFRAEREEQGA